MLRYWDSSFGMRGGCAVTDVKVAPPGSGVGQGAHDNMLKHAMASPIHYSWEIGVVSSSQLWRFGDQA
jgi:hypothetical protein